MPRPPASGPMRACERARAFACASLIATSTRSSSVSTSSGSTAALSIFTFVTSPWPFSVTSTAPELAMPVTVSAPSSSWIFASCACSFRACCNIWLGFIVGLSSAADNGSGSEEVVAEDVGRERKAAGRRRLLRGDRCRRYDEPHLRMRAARFSDRFGDEFAHRGIGESIAIVLVIDADGDELVRRLGHRGMLQVPERLHRSTASGRENHGPQTGEASCADRRGGRLGALRVFLRGPRPGAAGGRIR